MERMGAMLRSGSPFRAISRGEEDTTPVIDSFQEGSKKTQARKTGPSSLASTASQSVSRVGRCFFVVWNAHGFGSLRSLHFLQTPSTGRYRWKDIGYTG